MLKKVTNISVKIAERWIPDPLVIAIGLTAICFFLSVTYTPFSALDTIDSWGRGYWSLLAFTAQMILILSLGHLVAHTKPVNAVLVKIASHFKNAKSAYIGLTLIASFSSLFSWGIGLILPAVLSCIIASNLKKRNIKIHFPLLVYCGYAGSLVGMQGLSSTIPLILNTPNHFLADKIGLISLKDTIFSNWSMMIVLFIMITLSIFVSRLHPDKVREYNGELIQDREVDNIKIKQNNTYLSQKLENSRYITLLLGVFAFIYSVQHFVEGGSLNLNSLNMIFVVLGLLFADSAKHYIKLLSNAARVAGPFLIQYPLYAGLMGMMAESGLAEIFVNGFVAISNSESLAIWTFFSAGILNIFIPSAGGQWAVQGPIIIEAALQLGADMPRVIMAVVLGEVWTNAIQPLYLVPVLAITGLNIRDIMGYSILGLFLCALIYLSALVFF
ncbi:MAG: short-chain fatty acid transporter [Woeseiaceae bacterium]